MEAKRVYHNSKNKNNNFQEINEQEGLNFEQWAKAVRPQLLAALRKKSASS